jgi:hypothetical protein
MRITLCAALLLAAAACALAAHPAEETGGKKESLKKKSPKKKEEKAPAKPAAADRKATSKKNPPKGHVELKPELPKPMFIGTPKNFRSPNLEPRFKGKRPSIFVPEGAKNISHGKTVTSSDEEPIIGELELVTDGDKAAGEGCYVALGPGRQHVQIDLGKVYEIAAVVVWHYHANPRVYRDVVVQTADDPDFIMNVKTHFNNDHDNSSGLGIGKDYEYVDGYEGRPMAVKAAKARYVRLYSNGNTTDDQNHYIEVEVYGKPAK